MVNKLGESETEFLTNKYLSLGFSEQEAKERVAKTINLVIVSPLNVIQ